MNGIVAYLISCLLQVMGTLSSELGNILAVCDVWLLSLTNNISCRILLSVMIRFWRNNNIELNVTRYFCEVRACRVYQSVVGLPESLIGLGLATSSPADWVLLARGAHYEEELLLIHHYTYEVQILQLSSITESSTIV